VSDAPQLKIARSESQDKAVAALRKLLAEAESGDVLSFAAIVTRPGGRWSSVACGIRNGFETAGMFGAAWLDMQASLRTGGFPSAPDDWGT
jgi:hypothetical protein